LDSVRSIWYPSGMIRSLIRQFLNDEPSKTEASEDRLPLTVCVLLMEMASADEEVAPEERQQVTDAMRRRFNLSASDAEELINLSRAERSASNDLFRFTRLVNDTCTANQKREIMEEVWRVVYADGILDSHEDFLIHRLAKLLNLSHPMLIEAKMKVLDAVRGNDQGR